MPIRNIRRGVKFQNKNQSHAPIVRTSLNGASLQRLRCFDYKVGENLANNLLLHVDVAHDSRARINTITPAVTKISLSEEAIKLRITANKACGPDRVAPKMLKLAGDEILPSLISVYNSSADADLVEVRCLCGIQERRRDSNVTIDSNPK